MSVVVEEIEAKIRELSPDDKTELIRALVTMCIGGGQGIAAIFERVQ
jgi:acetyl-CoA acetyltransferase